MPTPFHGPRRLMRNVGALISVCAAVLMLGASPIAAEESELPPPVLDEPTQAAVVYDAPLLTVTGECDGSFVRVDVVDVANGQFVDGGEKESDWFDGEIVGGFTITVDLSDTSEGRYRVDLTCTFPSMSTGVTTSYFSEYWIDVTEAAESGYLTITDGAGTPMFPDNPPSTPDGVLRVLTPERSPGDSVSVAGDGFTPGEKVYMVVYSTPMLVGTLTADSSGSVSGSFTLPADLTPGSHTLVAYSMTRALAVPITVAVQAAQSQADAGSAGQTTLPATGSNGWALAIAGTGLLALGSTAVRMSRRRRLPHPSR